MGGSAPAEARQRPPAQARGVLRATACVGATLLLLAACGGGEEESSTTTTTTTSSASTSSSPTTTSPVTTRPPTTTTRPPRVIDVAYPSGGPKGPVLPPGTEAYRLLSAGSCTALLQEIDDPAKGWGVPRPGRQETTKGVKLRVFHLYRAAALACLGRWGEAMRDFDSLRGLGAGFGGGRCPEDPQDPQDECTRCHQLVYDWTANLIAQRRSDPGFSPRFVRRTGQPDPCPPATTTSSTSTTTSTTSTTTSTSSTSTTTTTRI